jgi:DNA invertase Pin-like site-specific DNA recombinase
MGEASGRWLRVSTKKQEEASQIPDVQAWEQSHGYDVQAEYVVHGASAFHGNRKFDETWQRVLKDIRNGKVTVLVVWKQDRLDRKLATFKMLEQVVEAGGRVEFVTQPHLNDLTTMAGRMALKLQEEIAHEESRTKSDRIRAMQANVRANDGLLSRPPFGYASEGDKYNRYLVPTPLGLKYVPEIFARCIAGQSLITIAKWLDSEGIKTDQGRKWSNGSIRHIINNQTYMGYRADRNGKVIGKCEAIIDAATFKRANDALSSRPKRGAILAENRALCSGILYCPKCGSPMYRLRCRMNRGTTHEYFYRCAGQGAQRKGCGNMVRLDVVDSVINDLMANSNEQITRRVFVPGHNHDAQIADVNFRIKQLDPEAMSDAEYDSALAALRQERDSYKSMPAVPDSWDEVPTGETYSGKWARLDRHGRNDWMREDEIRVCVAPAKAYPLDSEPEPVGVGSRMFLVQGIWVWFGKLS